MDSELSLRYLHFISILAIAGALTAEVVLLRDRVLTRAQLSRISMIDFIYGIASLTLLGAGLTLWLGEIGKPAIWYSGNWIFHLKLTLFIVMGLLSIYPTVFFLRNRKGDPNESVGIPLLVRVSVWIEIVLLAVIPALAGLMAKGIGLNQD